MWSKGKTIHQDGRGGLFQLEKEFPSTEYSYLCCRFPFFDFVCLLVMTCLLLVLDKFSSMKKMYIPSRSSTTHVFSDYFTIHKQATDLLATLFCQNKLQAIQKLKQKKAIEIGPFNLYLPFGAMLFKQSPMTKLLLSL
jgi:hypothetical protein